LKRFFIIGNPRSGTTLFRLMLNKHSSVSVPPEAGFLVWLYNEYSEFDSNFDYKSIVESLKNTNKIESWNLDFTNLQDFINLHKPITYSELMNVIYEFYSTIILRKDVKLYGDKNNYYLNHIKLLHKLYPDAKFIHIIRDGRSIAASYQDVMKKNISTKYAPNLPTKIEDIADEWIENIGSIEKEFTKLPKELINTIKYEDLILNPEVSLKTICDFLDIAYEVDMLEYYKTNEKDGLEPKEYMAWKSKNLQPLKKEEVRKFELLTNQDRKIFEKISENKLKLYGYIE